MKALLMIAFLLGVFFAAQAFAADSTPNCPHQAWKHGRLVCDDTQTNQ
jgi:hypothetical protein